MDGEAKQKRSKIDQTNGSSRREWEGFCFSSNGDGEEVGIDEVIWRCTSTINKEKEDENDNKKIELNEY